MSLSLAHDPRTVSSRDQRAEFGDAEAQFDLGLRYSTGDGLEVDYVTAHQWFNLAAMAGLPAARAMRAEIARDMSAEQIAEAQRRARAWLRHHTH